jgi:hypothetical protein
MWVRVDLIKLRRAAAGVDGPFTDLVNHASQRAV